MALGSLTAVPNASGVIGNKRQRVFDVQITAGANYTTGGETITPDAVGLKRIEQAHAHGPAKTATAAVAIGFVYQANGSVKAQSFASGTESTSNADLSGYTVRMTFVGY